jgi:hypothetical protein
LLKNSLLHLILGGAAVYRCDKRCILIAPLGAEVTCCAAEGLFQQTLQAATGMPRW